MHSRARYVRWQREKTYALLSSSQQVESSKIFSKTIDYFCINKEAYGENSNELSAFASEVESIDELTPGPGVLGDLDLLLYFLCPTL